MTKDDIKKALEICTELCPELCKRFDCPYYTQNCTDDILKDALNLITEQEKEIKKQNGRVKCLKTRLANKTVLLANVEEQYEYKTKCFEEEKQILANTIKKQDEEYNKAFERLKAQQREIDALKEENKSCKETAKEILSLIKLYATDSKTDLIDLIDEIAKANGVEVEE